MIQVTAEDILKTINGINKKKAQGYLIKSKNWETKIPNNTIGVDSIAYSMGVSITDLTPVLISMEQFGLIERFQPAGPKSSSAKTLFYVRLVESQPA